MVRTCSPGDPGSRNSAVASAIWEGVLAGLGRTEAADALTARLREAAVWPDILAEARRLRVAPLFYAGLQAAKAAAIPCAVMESARRSALAVGARSTRIEGAAAAVIAAASDARIPVLVLKGLALQHLVYPAGVARPMDDVDLLVAPADAPRLERLLRHRGYRTDFRGEEDFFSPDLSHSIDLHTNLVNTTRLPARVSLWDESFPALWQRRQTLRLADVSAWALGPQDFIQHLAVHAVHHHGMQGTLWMVDLLAAIQAWPLAGQATRGAPAAVRRSVWYCLDVLAARGHDPIPEVRAALRPQRLLPVERRVLARVARRECSVHIRYGFTLACLPRWADRVEFARQLLLPADGVHAAGLADAGPSPRHGWVAHWGSLVRLVTHQGFRGRPE